MRSLRFIFLSALLLLSLGYCKTKQEEPRKKDIVEEPAKMDKTVSENITDLITFADANKGKIDDTLSIKYLPSLKELYASNENAPIWSNAENWQPYTLDVLNYLDSAVYQGLIKEMYGSNDITQLKFSVDSSNENRKDAVRWAKADLLITAAFIGMAQDLKQGRLVADSQKLGNRPSMVKTFFEPGLKQVQKGGLVAYFASLQPKHYEYLELQKAIRSFADSMDDKTYTYLVYPYKDSLQFLRSLKNRLAESGISVPKGNFDSLSLRNAIGAYQKKRKIKADSSVSSSLVRSLNYTDAEKLKRIAISLDKYKSLPAKLPEKYIWVNIPSYYLKLWDNDTLRILSRVIVGKPGTPTPQLYSEISDMVLNPTWTVPASIIKKEMLPGLKKNPGYLSRRGLYLLNNAGERVDPYSVNWSKYTNGIPYRIQQGSGDDNALGLIKFNFKNPYSVYLHDTNVRRLFKNAGRSLSHGCVRVQEWESLAGYLALNDSLNLKPKDTLRYTKDSLNLWLAEGSYRVVPVTNRLPLYIKYFTCEGVEGKIRFYDDVYGEDKRLRERYFR